MLEEAHGLLAGDRDDTCLQGEVVIDEMIQLTGILAPLADPAFFAQVKTNLGAGTVTRPNGADGAVSMSRPRPIV